MLSLFCLPKPFSPTTRLIQENALKSWLNLDSEVEVIIIGETQSSIKTINNPRLRFLPKVKRNRFGTPLLNDAFKQAEKIAKYNQLLYINSDIIFLRDVLTIINILPFSHYLLTGRRIDLLFNQQIKFTKNWEKKLQREISRHGTPYRIDGLDYFLFPKGINWQMPPFAVGRTAWDNWMVYRARALKIPVIDASEFVKPIHSIHDYSHAGGAKNVLFGPEKSENWRLGGGQKYFFSLRDANFKITRKGRVESNHSRDYYWRQLETLPLFYPLSKPVVYFLTSISKKLISIYNAVKASDKINLRP